MYNPNTLKSPRATLPNPLNGQVSDLHTLQQSLLEKDKLISDLQGSINRLQLKNKQYSSYQQAMVEYEARCQELQGELLKSNEKLRAKNTECEQTKKKLQIQLKQKKQRQTSYVRHDDYMKLSSDFKKFRQVHSACQNSIKAMQKQNTEVDSYISQLKEEINSLTNIISAKNTQINELKVEKYQARSSQSIESHKDGNNRVSGNIISSFRILGEDSGNSNNTAMNQTQRMNYELLTYNRQNDQLRKKCQKLQQELQDYINASTSASTNHQNQQQMKIISEYEASLSTMANKLTAVHRLEMERNTIEQDRRKFQVQCEQLRQQLASRINYCDTLEKKIREIEHYKTAYMQTDLENFVTRNQKLTRQVDRLQKTVKQKYEQIVELKKNFLAVQITEQTFQLMEQTLTQLQANLNTTKLQLSKQQDKLLQKEQQHFLLQKQLKHAQIELSEVKSEMAKTNRIVSQKVQKIEFQTTEIKRMEKEIAEKKELSGKMAALEKRYGALEKKYEEQIDQSNQLAMSVIVLSAEIERREVTGNITKQFVTEFEALKTKSRQTQKHAKYLEQRVKRLEYLHKNIVSQSVKLSQHLQQSHKRWNHYDKSMQRLIQFLQQSNDQSNKKYEELDANIGHWLSQQEVRLKELAKPDALGEIPQYVSYIVRPDKKAQGQGQGQGQAQG